MTLKITIPGRPITKKNSMRIVRYRNGRYGIRPSERFEQYQRDSAAYIPDRMRIGIDWPVNVKCVYFMPTRHKVDLVNLLEATCDVLVCCGVLKDDNSKIVMSHDGSLVLYDKNRPRVKIEISEAKYEH